MSVWTAEVTLPGCELPPVSLDELDAVAALQIRRDRKYAIRPGELGAILGPGLAGARILTVDGRQVFDYRTVYYDTADQVSYFGCARRRRRRFKLRTRQRGESEPAWLEVKTRGPRGLTVKDRIGCLGSDLGTSDDGPLHRAGAVGYDGDVPELDRTLLLAALDVLALRGVVPPDPESLHPCLEVRYQRSTCLLPDGRSRATVDTGIAWGRPGEALTPVSTLAIIETKTTGPATALDRAAWSFGCRPVALSKFGVGLAATYPGLPAHRWQRLIHEYL